MAQFRCKKCKQLQFKHRLRGQKFEVEVKCYNCNTFNYFTVWLGSLLKHIKHDKKNNKHK